MLFESVVPSNSPYSPSQLIFGREMLFRTKTAVDWELLKRQRRELSKANNAKENKNRLNHDYKVGDKVMLLVQKYEYATRGKMTSPTDGVYTITKVHKDANGKPSGIVRIQRGNYEEDMSIRRLQPFVER